MAKSVEKFPFEEFTLKEFLNREGDTYSLYLFEMSRRMWFQFFMGNPFQGTTKLQIMELFFKKLTSIEIFETVMIMRDLIHCADNLLAWVINNNKQSVNKALIDSKNLRRT